MAKDFAKAFYQSKAWKSIRQEVLRDAHYTCSECDASRATEVHHIIELTPDNINNIYISLNKDNLRALCWQCHDKITKGYGDVADGYVFDSEGNVIRR